ncbi:hypothetical protein WG926_01340 [Tistrella sp. BH-R2-4]|jgi:hypothetical protein|uniref:DUF4136 domain-containing protein n=1 Tax=Tistrella arctica TaxID=3133430 RepID=A0ABU9YDR5_9PROT
MMFRTTFRQVTPSRRQGRRAALLLVASLGALVAACSGPTPYQPLLHGEGYANQRLEDNRFRVSFAGNAATDRATVEDYLLYRASEITLQTGHDFFIVVSRDVEPDRRYSYNPPPAWGWGWGSGRGAGYGIGMSTGSAEADTRYTAWLEILVYAGRKPDQPDAYDARQITQAIAPGLRRPRVD